MFSLIAEAAAGPIVPPDYSVPWFIAYPIVVVMGAVIAALFKALLSANGKKSAEEVQREADHGAAAKQAEIDHQKRIDKYIEVLEAKEAALERCQDKRVAGSESAVAAITISNERNGQVIGRFDELLAKLDAKPSGGG